LRKRPVSTKVASVCVDVLEKKFHFAEKGYFELGFHVSGAVGIALESWWRRRLVKLKVREGKGRRTVHYGRDLCVCDEKKIRRSGLPASSHKLHATWQRHIINGTSTGVDGCVRIPHQSIAMGIRKNREPRKAEFHTDGVLYPLIKIRFSRAEFQGNYQFRA
jgi:hypothetical protein